MLPHRNNHIVLPPLDIPRGGGDFTSLSSPSNVAAAPVQVLLQKIGSAYTSSLANNPIVTNIATAAVLSLVADGIAQIATRTKAASASSERQKIDKMWDVTRSSWILVWGSIVTGYLLSFWFAFLGWLYPDARTSWMQLVAKVCTNQLFLSPTINGGFFAFVVLTRMKPIGRFNTEKWNSLKQKLKLDLLPTCLKSTAYWSIVQTLNFRVFPDSVTVLSSNVFFLFWTVYLSIIGNRSSSRTEPTPMSEK